MVAIVDHDSCLRSSGSAYGALVRDASNVPVEPGNDLPPPGVVCVRGLARQPPDPREGTLVTSRMEVRSALGPAITRATSDHEDPLPRLGQPTPKTKQIAKLTTAVVLAAIAIVLCVYAFILTKQ